MSETGESSERDKIQLALQKAFLDSDEMITKWFLVAETVTEDGVPGVWTMAPTNQNMWDSQGLLKFATNKVDARQIYNVFKEQERDV